MKKTLLHEIPAALLILLFLYAAFSKYFDLHEFTHSMNNQPLPQFLRTLIYWGLPPMEIITSLLLMMPGTRLLGYRISLSMLVAFTFYIGIILLHFFPHIPCTCGGLISTLTWNQHLIFNLFFIAVNILGLISMKTGGKTYFTREIGLNPGPEKTGAINHS